MQKKLTIWVMTERGLTGTENQCLGVAEALARRFPGEIVTKRIGLKWPQRLWSPYLGLWEHVGMVTEDSDPIVPPYPDILIAAGRKAIAPARAIRRASKGHTFVCILQHPRVNLDDFDLVAMPVHDWKNRVFSTLIPTSTSARLLLTHGAPNRITPELLMAAREKWAGALGPLPAPRIAVLIGGNSKTHRLGTAQMDDIIANLRTRQEKEAAGLMITVSRRTPKDLVEKLCAAFPSPLVGEGGRAQARPGEGIKIRESFSPHPPHLTMGPLPLPQGERDSTTFIYTGEGDNPYHGFLAFADYIVCTNDSTSMLSDAATTGKPIEIIPLPGGSKRHERFMTHLASYGIGAKDGTYPPFRDAEDVAFKIQELLEQRKKKDSIP